MITRRDLTRKGPLQKHYFGRLGWRYEPSHRRQCGQRAGGGGAQEVIDERLPDGGQARLGRRLVAISDETPIAFHGWNNWGEEGRLKPRSPTEQGLRFRS